MKNINTYRKSFADLRDIILIEIFAIIRNQPNWYMQIQDVLGKLIFKEIDMQTTQVIQSVTVKDFGDHGEKSVVWIGVYEEEYYIAVETLDIELMINVLEAMHKALE